MSELIRFSSGRRNSDASLGIWRIAERQWGVISWQQLLDAGVGRATVARWVAAGRLHRVFPGVYAVGHLQLTDHGRLAAALLYAGKGSALSHMTAAWWWGCVKRRPAQLDVSTPNRRTSLQALNLHHPRQLDRVFHRGLPVTPPARTLLESASLLPRRRLRKAVAETLYLRLASPDEIRAVLKRGHRGSAALRDALDSHAPQLARSRSEMEDAFLELCERFGLPIPKLNERIEGFEVDAVWRDHRVAVELDSELAHGTTGSVHRDRARDMRLRAAGWTVRRYSWWQVEHEPEQVARDLADALQSANRGRRPGAAVEPRRR